MRELEWAATKWASRWGSGCVDEHLSELVGGWWVGCGEQETVDRRRGQHNKVKVGTRALTSLPGALSSTYAAPNPLSEYWLLSPHTLTALQFTQICAMDSFGSRRCRPHGASFSPKTGVEECSFCWTPSPNPLGREEVTGAGGMHLLSCRALTLRCGTKRDL